MTSLLPIASSTSGVPSHPNTNSTANNPITESQRRINLLSNALSRLSSTTTTSILTTESLIHRSRHLDSLTSPASDASAALTQASTNLAATLVAMKDAREKFDTVNDCEPAIERLMRGVREMNEYATSNGGDANNDDDNRSIVSMSRNNRRGSIAALAFMPSSRNIYDSQRNFNDDGTVGGGTLDGNDDATILNGALTEQDVYAAADSMEILRDAHLYFMERQSWKSASSALGNLVRVHRLGVDGMCLLVQHHLTYAGPAVRLKRMVRGDATVTTAGGAESAKETRNRLAAALQNRDLMKSVGEYQEYLPLDTRSVRELRAIFECLGGDGCFLGPEDNVVLGGGFGSGLGGSGPLGRLRSGNVGIGGSVKVTRTEKIGSGFYTNLVKRPLNSKYLHLNSYADARKTQAFNSIDGYYRHLRTERKKTSLLRRGSIESTGVAETIAVRGEVDAAARDAVRCLEHAMVIVQGEKSIYKCVVSPTSSHTHDETKVPREYKQALVASYNHVVSAVVDRVMDIIESCYTKDCGLAYASSNSTAGTAVAGGGGGNNASLPPSDNQNQHGENSSATSTSPHHSVRFCASAAAAALRILDGVRMLGPSLAKLCEISVDKKVSSSENITDNKSTDSPLSVAANLCIGIHRTSVKSGARALEMLAKSIQTDPLDGEKYRPQDARVAAVSSDVVRAIRLVAPFVSAYKSVTKRRSLPWDPKIQDGAGDLELFVKYLVRCLLHNLKGKALSYARDDTIDAKAKSSLFMMNNTYYLLEQLSLSGGSGFAPADSGLVDGEDYKISSSWFREDVSNLLEGSKNAYLAQWEELNKHLTAVDQKDLAYQKDKLLNLESGRLLKSRFSGFNEEFEKTYSVHKELTVIDPKLRVTLLEDVKGVFLNRYKKFYANYSRIQFSKKKMDEYLKYPPQRVESMLGEMYSCY